MVRGEEHRARFAQRARKKRPLIGRPHANLLLLVGVGGFEPPTSSSRTMRANRAALHPVTLSRWISVYEPGERVDKRVSRSVRMSGIGFVRSFYRPLHPLCEVKCAIQECISAILSLGEA